MQAREHKAVPLYKLPGTLIPSQGSACCSAFEHINTALAHLSPPGEDRARDARTALPSPLQKPALLLHHNMGTSSNTSSAPRYKAQEH